MRQSYLLAASIVAGAFGPPAFAQVNLLHPPHHVYLTPKPAASAATTTPANSVTTPATPAPAQPVSSAATSAPAPHG